MCAPTEVDSTGASQSKGHHATVAALESDSQVLRQVEKSQGTSSGSGKLKLGLASVQAHTSTESGLSGPMVPARFTMLDDAGPVEATDESEGPLAGLLAVREGSSLGSLLPAATSGGSKKNQDALRRGSKSFRATE